MSQPERSPNTVRHVPHALDGSAPTAIEYAIIAVLIAAVAVGTWKTFGEPQLTEPAAPTQER